MPTDSRIVEAIESALAAGISEQSLIGILSARGWSERDIYSALAGYHERHTGIQFPQRTGAGASAREAFFYLLIFSTLATWTIGLGSLAISLIDRWFADPLFAGSGQQFNAYTVAASLAAIIVSFPLFLLVSRVVASDIQTHPDRIDSSIRKWLTYMALVIAAAVFMGDLITALTYLLRGEITSRFMAKSFVVLVLSGGVFYYYFGGLKRIEDFSLVRRRDRMMAAVASAIVVLMLILGFWQLGPPRIQREKRADLQRANGLYQLSDAVNNYWTENHSQLPATLSQLPSGLPSDPVTHQPYKYLPGQNGKYSLCATFAQSSYWNPNSKIPRDGNPWGHPAGYYCFQLDARAGPSGPWPYGGAD